MKETPFSADQIGKSLARLLQGPQNPELPFVRGGASYAEVYSLAAGLRRRFGQRNPGEPGICLALDNKALVAAALLAALAGGPPLLLPHALSAQGLEQLHERTGSTLALIDRDRPLPAVMQAVSVKPLAAPLAWHNQDVPGEAELLRIFTGGSTGSPQIWSKTAINLFCEGFFLAHHFQVGVSDTILATIPPYHIYGLLYSVIMPLVAGATVIEETPSFPNEIVATIRQHHATILAAVPAHYRVLRDKALGLRLAFSSAGMLDREDAEDFARHNPRGIVEVYGSTETGGIATRSRARGEEQFTPFSLISWKRCEGRLAVASPYLSPELGVDGDGYFLTNDRIKVTEDGGFLIKGRIDAITKVGGKRVDLDEIWVLIKGMEAVEDCYVIALPEPSGREHRICALVEGEQVDCQGLLKTLALSLEPYALPKRLQKVTKIPMTGSGKYDRQAIILMLEES
jgi:acyl-coenzyme A synthetase/AMP-(fatty) acid ligase